jgi:hypothetical protein
MSLMSAFLNYSKTATLYDAVAGRATHLTRSTTIAHGTHTTEGRLPPGFPGSDVFEVFVKSSHIVSSGYSRAHQILYIKFDNNIVYGYLSVPELIFTAFIAADSHGAFANQNIYQKFEFLRY